MDCSLGQIILAVSNSDGEDAFWTQMLVLVVLVASWGVYSLVKTRAKPSGEQRQGYDDGSGSRGTQLRRRNKVLGGLKERGLGVFSKLAQSKAVIEKPVFDFGAGNITSEGKLKSELAGGRGKDLAGGMEMLEQDFLVGVVEETKDKDKNDVMMRKLCFNELLRRGQLKAADSKSLKVYAKNEGNFYGKDIQCEAMKELAERTGLGSG